MENTDVKIQLLQPELRKCSLYLMDTAKVLLMRSSELCFHLKVVGALRLGLLFLFPH